MCSACLGLGLRLEALSSRELEYRSHIYGKAPGEYSVVH